MTRVNNDFIRMEYWGSLTELRGKTALVTSYPENAFSMLDPNKYVQAQFDDKIEFNGKRLDLGWHPFPKSHFQKGKS